jgi:hypothetical protein
MASKYGYALVKEVENRSGIDYSKKLQKYTDIVIESVISQGEREINTKTGTVFTGVRGYQECGLTNKNLDTATGLSVTTTYYFKINVDGQGEVEYNITTAGDVTYDAIIILMNNAISSVRACFHLVNGDLRCSSFLFGSSSSIALAAGTGTDLFGTLTGFSAFDVAVVGSGNIPDAVSLLSIELAYRRMYNMMIFDGPTFTRDKGKRLMPIWDDDLMSTLDPYISKEITPIRNIVMYNNNPSVRM